MVGVKRHNFQVHVAIVGGYRDTKFDRVGDLLYRPDWPKYKAQVLIPIPPKPQRASYNSMPPVFNFKSATKNYELKTIQWMDDVLTDFWQRVN